MTAQNFAPALEHVLVHEGGFVNHPKDPGGATMKGVTQGVYDAWRERRGQLLRSVRQIEERELQDIYRRQYWLAIKGDQLPAGVDYVVFDGAVNSGPAQSIKWLQRALGTVRVDGVIGEATLAAVDAHHDHDQLIELIIGRRLAFLQALKTWSTFKGGWSRRVAQVKQIGQAWATGSVAPRPVFFAGGEVKAGISQAKPLPTKGFADASTGAGLGGLGVSGAVSDAKDALMPLSGAGGWIDNIIVALVVASALCVVGGLAYRFLYANRKAQARADALDLPSGVTA